MNLIELCIKRPAFTIVLSLVITVIGMIGYMYLPIRWIPNVDPPVISISTAYPGASANLVETQITSPIENSLSGIDGIDNITSYSKESSSFITITFKMGSNLNGAVEDVRSALQRIDGGLPKDAKQPQVEKADTVNGTPILFLTFSDYHRTPKDVSDYVKLFIMPRLQTIDGVASVVTFGERTSAMHIWLDPMKMASSNVTVDDINRALNEQNVQVPSGQIRSAARYYSIVTNATLDSVQAFNNLIIYHDQAQTVRLKNIGQAVVDAANSDSAFRVQSQNALAIGIIPQSNANPLDVANQVKKEFKLIQKTLPTGMQAKIVFDQASYIQSSVNHVYESLFESIGLVLIVIFLFLGSWRAAFIPIITIPVCLIGTFAAMYWLGFSINTITLMAFVLAIGLVVDDAIVMLENIMRYIESGMTPFAAAIKGGKEIVFPIIAMTLTLAVVYAPIAMTTGILNAVFKEFALTLAFTVIISGFVSLTLSPMMCSRLLPKTHTVSRYQLKLTQRLDFLKIKYSQLLQFIFNKKSIVIGILFLVALLGWALFKYTPSELAPTEDMNAINIYVSAPRNSSFQYTDKYVKELEKKIAAIPEVESYLSQIGRYAPSKAYQMLNLVPMNHRKKTASQIADSLQLEVKNFPGVDVYVFPEPSPLAWSSHDGSDVSLQVMSSSDYKELHQIMQQMIEAAKKSPVFLKVDNRLKWDGEQFDITIDREKMADASVSMQSITNTISTLLAGRTVGHFEYGGNQYDVIMKMNETALSNPNIISQLYVRSNLNQMLPLSDLITLKETTTPEMLPHFERMRSDRLSASLAPGYTISDGIQVMQKMAKEILPDYAKYSFVGEAKNFLESNGKMGVTFLLALVFIYLVLVAQFESFIDPLIILLTVPFAMIGGLILLRLGGGSLNIYSDIGLVTLIGLISKHGILITEFANRQRSLGKGLQEAVIEAAQARLRPILMTTAAMILGALPLAFAMGPGAETRHQIGWVIVGGLLLGTFFSLIVVPVAYTYLARFKNYSYSIESIGLLEDEIKKTSQKESSYQ